MSTTLGIVEVPPRGFATGDRKQSIRSPARLQIAGRPLLEWVVRRVTESQLLDSVTVLMDRSQSHSLEALTPADVMLVVGRQADALGRFAAALRRFDASQAVRVKVDSPFIDPELIDRLICTANAHPGTDYIGYRSETGTPEMQSRLGVFAEWCRAEAVYHADRMARQSCERDDSLWYLRSHPERFQARMIPIPPALDRHDVRLTVDLVEDWEHAQSIFEALGPDSLDWHAIAGLLDEHPAMRQRMAVLNQADRKAL